MNEEVRKAAIEFYNKVEEHSYHNQVSVTLFVNSEGFTVEYKEREHQALVDHGISMKNIKGEWV